MLVSPSELASFRRCKRQWKYHNLWGLSRQTANPAFVLGTLIHESFANWLTNSDQNLVEYFITYSQQKFDSIKKYYEIKRGVSIPDEEFQSLLDMIKLGTAMCINYELRWKKPLPDGFELFAPEQTISVKIPESFDWKGEQNYLQGRLDALLKDEHDRLFILEHKTFSVKPDINKLIRDSQFIDYIWMVSQLGMGEVFGLAYDGLLKKAKPGKEQILADLFYRVPIKRSLNALKNYENELRLQVSEMSCEKPIIYKSIPWNGCGWQECSFIKLCDAETENEDIDNLINTMYTRSGEEDNVAE